MIMLYAAIAVSAALLAAAGALAVPVVLAARRERVQEENARTAIRAARYAASGMRYERESEPGWLSRRLAEAGSKSTAASWTALTALLSFLAATAIWFATSSAPAALLAAGVCAAARMAQVALARSRRTSRFEDQLSDALPMVAENLRSGNGPARSLTAVASYMPDPLKEEFSQAVAEMGMGVPFPQAMDSMLERVPCNDLRLLNGVIAVNAESGGDLSSTIDGIAETMQRRSQMRGHIKSITASGRMSARIVVALPWIILAVMWLMSPGYLDPLFASGTTGVALIACVAGLDIIGYLLIRRICTVEFD